MLNARDKGFSPEGVDICRKAADFCNRITGIRVQCDQLEDCEFEKGTYSVVTLIHTFEHLPNPKSALNCIRRLLKNEGVICGIVPNIESFCSTALQNEWHWLDSNTHYVHFSPSSLRKILEENGFEVISLTTHTGDYDKAVIDRLLALKSGCPLSDGVLKAETERLWENGQGEEIRFFAKKNERYPDSGVNV